MTPSKLPQRRRFTISSRARHILRPITRPRRTCLNAPARLRRRIAACAASSADWHAATRIGREFLTFLAEAYEYKSIADYGIGSPSITDEDARLAIDAAGRLIDCIAALLA